MQYDRIFVLLLLVFSWKINHGNTLCENRFDVVRSRSNSLHIWSMEKKTPVLYYKVSACVVFNKSRYNQ